MQRKYVMIVVLLVAGLSNCRDSLVVAKSDKSGVAKGSVVLSLSVPDVASNCKASSLGGAGITGITILLIREAGGCAPLVFTRLKDNIVIDTYTVNCSSPQISPCIERDETLNTFGVPPDNLLIHVNGKIGATNCWESDDVLRIQDGQILTRTLDLIFQPKTPGCQTL